MKKIIYAIFAVLTLGFSFAACGDDNNDEIINYSTSAEQASAGTYNGTWTRIGDNGVPENFSGSITLTPGSAAGVSVVTFSCPEAKLEASSVANVWNIKHGFRFLNQVTDNNPDNTLGAAFAGEIDENGVMTISFTINQRSGRQLVKYNFAFKGNK
jgi:hypothetical protein